MVLHVALRRPSGPFTNTRLASCCPPCPPPGVPPFSHPRPCSHPCPFLRCLHAKPCGSCTPASTLLPLPSHGPTHTGAQAPSHLARCPVYFKDVRGSKPRGALLGFMEVLVTSTCGCNEGKVPTCGLRACVVCAAHCSLGPLWYKAGTQCVHGEHQAAKTCALRRPAITHIPNPPHDPATPLPGSPPSLLLSAVC